jgi:hypothetical protein
MKNEKKMHPGVYDLKDYLEKGKITPRIHKICQFTGHVCGSGQSDGWFRFAP